MARPFGDFKKTIARWVIGPCKPRWWFNPSGSMLDIEQWAKERARQTGEPYMAWLDALSEGQSLQPAARLNDREFRVLLDACPRPRTCSLLMEALDEYAREHPQAVSGFILLADHADDSPYSLTDWAMSLEYLYDWLAQAGRVSPGLKPLLEYIGCCVEAAASAPAGYPLSGLVEEMLDRYGMESV